jgi:histidinol-phosphate/aromatic aminotransferase/cobyric acid decarboxylase-like protein
MTLAFNWISLSMSIRLNAKHSKTGTHMAIDPLSTYPDCECWAMRTALFEKSASKWIEFCAGMARSDLISHLRRFPETKGAHLAPTFRNMSVVAALWRKGCEFAMRNEIRIALTRVVLEALDDSIECFFLVTPITDRATCG